MPAAPYPYPVPNSQLISALALERHFEGGLFAQTVALAGGAGSGPGALLAPAHDGHDGHGGHDAAPAADAADDAGGAGDAGPADATQIFYLLTPDSYRGKMHMNLHATFHTHHAGRALYTLIRPPKAGARGPPEVRRVTVGPHVAAGEVLQLFVPGGWWKASEIPAGDMGLVRGGAGGGARAGRGQGGGGEGREGAEGVEEGGERIGCLISEVVVPGWTPEQHQFIDEAKLKAMWNGDDGWQEYLQYTVPPDGLAYPDK